MKMADAVVMGVEFPPNMPLKYRLFVIEYLKSMDALLAARRVGFSQAAAAVKRLMDPKKNPDVVRIIQQHVAKIDRSAQLNANYVREYIHTIMEFKPGLYFKPAGDGGWMIPEDFYYQLPDNIQRIVEEIEVREVSTGEGDNKTTARFMWVKFVSKTSAMVTAARYTLTQKLEVTKQNVNLDELMERLIKKRAERSVQNRLDQAMDQAKQATLPALPAPPSPSVNGHA